MNELQPVYVRNVTNKLISDDIISLVPGDLNNPIQTSCKKIIQGALREMGMDNIKAEYVYSTDKVQYAVKITSGANNEHN